MMVEPGEARVMMFFGKYKGTYTNVLCDGKGIVVGIGIDAPLRVVLTITVPVVGHLVVLEVLLDKLAKVDHMGKHSTS